MTLYFVAKPIFHKWDYILEMEKWEGLELEATPMIMYVLLFQDSN